MEGGQKVCAVYWSNDYRSVHKATSAWSYEVFGSIYEWNQIHNNLVTRTTVCGLHATEECWTGITKFTSYNSPRIEM